MCVLARARGRVEACRFDACPFWEPGGVVVSGDCLLRRTGLDLEGRPELVSRLEEIRGVLEQPATRAEELAARTALRDLLGGDADPPEKGRP